MKPIIISLIALAVCSVWNNEHFLIEKCEDSTTACFVNVSNGSISCYPKELEWK